MYKAANRRTNRWLNVLGAVTVIAAATGCGSGDKANAKKAPGDSSARFSDYKVTMFTGWKMSRFDVPAPNAASARVAEKSQDSGGGGRPGASSQRLGAISSPAQRLAIIDRLEKHENGGEGGVTFETERTDVDLSSTDNAQFALIWGAAYECGMGCAWLTGDDSCIDGDTVGEYYHSPQHARGPGVGSVANIFANSGEGWNMTCEVKLLQQEMLVCMAEKLVELAEAVGPVVWDSVLIEGVTDDIEIPKGIPGGPWIISPLQDQERFIVREQAIRLLGQLATIDTMQSGPSGGWVHSAFSTLDVYTCDEAYYDAIVQVVDEATWGSVAYPLLGVGAGENPPFDGQPVEATYLNSLELIKARMKRRVSSLQLAGELLRAHLFEKSVYANMAGAYQQRAAATDPVRGLRLMWGTAEGPLTDEQDRKYNNLHHAARMLFGRWDEWPPSDVPSLAEDVIDQAGPLFIGSRDRDLPVATAGEESAASLFMAAGIVVPEVIEYPGPGLPRAVLRDQLMVQEAADRGIALDSDDFDQLSESAAVGKGFDALSDNAIAFALNKTRVVFSQLTGLRLIKAVDSDDAPDDTASIIANAARYGFTPGEHRSEEFEDVGGLVWEGGLPMSSLAGDVMARALPMPAAAVSGTLCQFAVPGCYGDVWQSAFHLGSTLQANLGAMQFPTNWSDLARERNRALGQYNAWAGPGQLRVIWDSTAEILRVRAIGNFAEAFGWPEANDGEKPLIAVVGEYWAADCVAGNRPENQCPGDPGTNAVVLPYSWATSSTSPEETARRDGSSRVDLFRFHASDPLIQAVLYGDADGYRPKLYLVSRKLKKTAQNSQVLAQVVPEADYFRMYVVGDHQRELANAALGVSPEAATQGTYLGASTTGDPQNYCIPGVRKDEFVPLENELTENSDAYENSWRYYLDLAQNAADRAQTIADQIFDLDLQQKIRFEGAQEEYAKMCGDFSDFSGIEWTDGVPSEEQGSESASQCLNEEKWDVVFLADLGEDEKDLASLAAKAEADDIQDYIKHYVLQCTEEDNREACGREVQYTSINKGIKLPSFKGPAEVPAGCALVKKAHDSLLTGFESTKLQQEGIGDWRDESALLEVIDGLRLVADNDGEWSLSYWDEAVMDSRSTLTQRLWPGCLWNPDAAVHCSVPDSESETVNILDALFREPGTDPDDPAYKLAYLWRVEGALWYLAGLAGVAPHGLMTVPYPTVNFGTCSSADFFAPYPTVFGGGLFDPDAETPGGYLLRPISPVDTDDARGLVSATDRDVLGTVVPINSAFGVEAWDKARAPLWIQDLYVGSSCYFHAQATTPDITFAPKPAGAKENDVGSFLGRKMDDLKGTTCTCTTALGYSGGGSGDAAADAKAEGANLWRQPKRKRNTEEVILCTSTNGRPTFSFDFGGAAYGGGRPYTRDRLKVWNPGGDNWHVDGLLLAPENYHPRFALTQNDHFWGRLNGCPEEGKPAAYPVSPGYLNVNCATNYSDPKTDEGDEVTAYTRAILRPVSCSANQRAPVMTNVYVPQSPCEAMDRILGALGLACLASGSSFSGLRTDITDLPRVSSEQDIPFLERWAARLGQELDQLAGSFYVEDVPKRALLGTDTNFRGDQGETVAMVAEDIANIASAWGDAGKETLLIETDLRQLKNDIKGIHLNAEIDQHQAAIERLQIANDIIEEERAIVNSFSMEDAAASFGAVAAIKVAANGVASLAAIVNNLEKLDHLGEIVALEKEQAENDISTAFNAFTASLIERTHNIGDAFDRISQSILRITAAQQQFGFGQDMARYYAAQASGQPFAEVNGVMLDLPVNKAINDRLNVLKRRKAMVETEARYLAYLTRRAIEQRIGMRLNDIDVPIGNWAAPATWADDICSLDPADYDNVDFSVEFDDSYVRKTFDPTEQAIEDVKRDVIESIQEERGDLLSIADYVNRLANFVAFYTMTYPFKDAEDVTVLSLKDDLLPKGTQWCTLESRNLLVNSGALHDMSTGTGGAEWRRSGCAESICLTASKYGGSDLPEDSMGGAATLLMESLNEAVGLDQESPWGAAGASGADDEGETTENGVEAEPPAGIPDRSMYQSLTLEPGSYLLSWWDHVVLDGSGNPLTSGPYRVTVVGPDGMSVAGDSVDTAGTWSPRHVLRFRVKDAGVYSVVFGAAEVGADASAVLIANVQLEAATSESAKPTGYQHTGSNRTYLSHDCQGSEIFLKRFEHQCNNGRCYYELVTPFTIDTKAIVKGRSPLANKFASGNFNFRHIDVAMNVVGTGVIDCSNSDELSCYGTGVLEYTLEHLAYNAQLIDHNGNAQRFDFGMGAVRNGRALATERYITLPIGSADNDLLRQPQITKTELSGRPLDGVYRFRIYEEPTLVWGNIEDIQLILHHRYWSRVSKDPMNGP